MVTNTSTYRTSDLYTPDVLAFLKSRPEFVFDSHANGALSDFQADQFRQCSQSHLQPTNNIEVCHVSIQ